MRQYEYWTNRSPLVRNDKRTAYDLAGRVVCQWMVGSSGACDATSPARVEYAYDAADRLVTETQDGRAVGYEYDPAGNRTGIVWPDGKHADYSYTARHQLASVSFEAVTLAAYSYDIQGRATGASFGNGNSAAVTHEVDDDLSLLAYALKDEAGAARAPRAAVSGCGRARLWRQLSGRDVMNKGPFPRSLHLFIVGGLLPLYRDSFYQEGNRVTILDQQLLVEETWKLVTKSGDQAKSILICNGYDEFAPERVEVVSERDLFLLLHHKYGDQFLIFSDCANWVVWSIDPEIGVLIASEADFELLSVTPQAALEGLCRKHGICDEVIRRNIAYFNNSDGIR